MDVKDTVEVIKNNKLLVFVITVGSSVILYLTEVMKKIELNNLWKVIFYCCVIFGSIYLIITLFYFIFLKIGKAFTNKNLEISEYEYEILDFFSKQSNQSLKSDEISGVDETEKQYFLRQLVDKGLLYYSWDYYSLTHLGREKLLYKRQSIRQ